MASKKNIKTVMGSLRIDFSNFDVKDESGEYYYRPPEVIQMRRKRYYVLNWSAEELSNVEEQLTIYTTVPLLCKGEECDFSGECPLVKNSTVGRWVGHGCPLEIVDAFRHFAGYVNDLDIRPEDYTDIQMVNDLVRLQIQLTECDKLKRKEAPVEVMVAGTDSKTGLRHNSRQPSQLLEQQRRLRQDINKHYQLLLASRQARKEAERKSMGESDITNVMTQVLAQYNSERKMESLRGGRGSSKDDSSDKETD